jgi:hypothetical protein
LRLRLPTVHQLGQCNSVKVSRWEVALEELLAARVWDEHDVRDDLVEHLGKPGVLLVSAGTAPAARPGGVGA